MSPDSSLEQTLGLRYTLCQLVARTRSLPSLTLLSRNKSWYKTNKQSSEHKLWLAGPASMLILFFCRRKSTIKRLSVNTRRNQLWILWEACMQKLNRTPQFDQSEWTKQFSALQILAVEVGENWSYAMFFLRFGLTFTSSVWHFWRWLSWAGCFQMQVFGKWRVSFMSRFGADALQMSASIYPKVCQVVFWRLSLSLSL